MRRLLAALVAISLLGATACGASDDGPDPVRVAFVRSVPDAAGNTPFAVTLAANGYKLGENLVFVQDDPDGEVLLGPDAVRTAVEGWVRGGVDLIVAFSSSGAKDAALAAPDTPILFLVNDPVAVGLLKDEARPDRNLTGLTFRVPADRTLDLARQAIPSLDRLGILVPATDPAGPPSRDSMLAAATGMRVTTVVEEFADEQDIERAVAALAAREVDAVAVVNTPTSVRFMSAIEPYVTTAGLPMIANTSLATRAVVVLEPNVDALLTRLGRQAARLLNGTPPRDIPVEDPVEFRVILNRAVATELGLPPFTDDLLRQADLVTG